MNLEVTILNNLISNEEFTRKVLPFLKSDYFTVRSYKIIFAEIHEYISNYNALPSLNALSIECQERTDLSESQFKDIMEVLSGLSNEKAELDWIIDSTEKWCQERAIYLSLMESVKIADGQDEKRDKGAIPQILSDALGVSFDQNVGHDYLQNYEERYDFYHKTEEKIAERIDANLLNVPIQKLHDLPRAMYENKISALSKKTQGKLIIKEYPTASAHVGHFKALLNELELKRNIKPDIIFVDYLNICASQRYKGSIVNSYTYVKAIAEELRGLAVETNVPIVTATQTTRSGFGSSDVDLTDTSESFGLPATADLMFALISTEELEEQNQIMVKQLKNRYHDPTLNKRFCLGIDRSKMRLYDVDEAQKDLVDAGVEDKIIKKISGKKSFAELKYD